MQPPITPRDLDFLARRAGLALTEAEAAELLAIDPLIRKLAARVRADRPREAEPAHVFKP